MVVNINDDKMMKRWWVYDGDYPLDPSGKHTKNHGTSQFFMGKLTISMAAFNSYVSLPEGSAKLQLPGNWRLEADILHWTICHMISVKIFKTYLLYSARYNRIKPMISQFNIAWFSPLGYKH